ncbi:MAG: 1,4-dihydroxy-2-naphthoate polyprenyltransferase [Actinomycetota bacterium]|nr:1,4-dihydroxy-2-naphthoate polyprenyltransferase [Actinomycetota bacterium]
MRTCSCYEGQPVDPLSRLLVVTRACVQPMTVISVAIAGLLAVRISTFDLLLFALAALGSIVAHAANNMINDYFDLKAGLDTELYPRSQYAPHPVLSGMIDKRKLFRWIIAANVIDAAIMVVLFAARGWPILAFALGGLVLSVGYVAPPLKFKYRGLGEPSVFLVWGPVMVGGTYFAATGRLSAAVILASIPYALLVTSVLMGKHVDKLPWDVKEGVRTLPVVLGEARGRRVTVGLLISYYASVVVLVTVGVLPVWALLVLAALPTLKKTIDTYTRPKPEAPPPRYPIWPLWFGPWAFRHSERAGALLLAGLVLGAIFPVWL